MSRYRLSDVAQVDVINILAWIHEQSGEAARLHYENLTVAALRGVATQPDRPGYRLLSRIVGQDPVRRRRFCGSAAAAQAPTPREARVGTGHRH